jgi:hypothetical protein
MNYFDCYLKNGYHLASIIHKHDSTVPGPNAASLLIFLRQLLRGMSATRESLNFELIAFLI